MSSEVMPFISKFYSWRIGKKSMGTLISALGKSTGETLYNGVRGVDGKKLELDKPRKSVSCEIKVTFFLFLFEVVLRLNIFIFYLVRRDTFWDQWKGRGFYSSDGQWSQKTTGWDWYGWSILSFEDYGAGPYSSCGASQGISASGFGFGVINWHLFFFFSSNSWVMMSPAISLKNKHLLVLEEDPQGWSDHRRSCTEIAEILQLWCERVKRHRDTGAKTKRISGSSDTSGGQAVLPLKAQPPAGRKIFKTPKAQLSAIQFRNSKTNWSASNTWFRYLSCT